VYVPAVLFPKLIVPVLPVMDRPPGLAVYVPPDVPVRVTVAVPVVAQYGEPPYAIVADGACCTITGMDADASPQVLDTVT
jgi:hypothetical protein